MSSSAAQSTSGSTDEKPRQRQLRRPLDVKMHGRSAITNGNVLLARIDNRSFWARRYKDLYRGMLSDIGGDSAAISESQKLLVRRGALLALECERREAAFAKDGADDVQLEIYTRAAGALRRVVEMLNIPLPTGPSNEEDLVANYKRLAKDSDAA
jgi:hypothetical protein